MFLRRHGRNKDGKDHGYWSLCETIRTPAGPRQRTLCYLGELNGSEHARWRKTISVFNAEGEEKQLQLFPEEAHATESDPNVVQIRLDRVGWERPRHCGDVVLGLHLWRQLELDRFWAERMDGLPGEVRWSLMAALLAVNRLLAPGSELSIEDRWYATTALDDLLGIPQEHVHTDRLYRTLDRMLPHKEALEKHLRKKYGELFGVTFDVLLYDLTSTYLEGEAARNPQAQRGYSRDHRPDCKQVILALVVSEEGFPLAYEVFDGNRVDVTTLEEILGAVESKYGRAQRVWVFDRGIVSEDNLEILREHQGLYLVGTPRSALRHFEGDLLSAGWKRIRPEVEVKLIPIPGGQETYVLCRSQGRKLKEQAMHQRQIQRVEAGLSRLSEQVASDRMREEVKIQRRIGALLARNPQVADLYEVHLKKAGTAMRLMWRKNPAKNRWASLREGHYLLRTNLKDRDPEALWEKYVQLTEVEASFRALKSELAIRPIWHQRQDRVQAHILVAFLGYCLWVSLKQNLKRARLDLSPAKALHLAGKIYSGDILLQTTDGRTLRLRRICKPEPNAAHLLHALKVSLPQRLNRDLELQNVVQT